tara:strand:+ start:1169 stop:1363 length:195 start_codon:yes stop_codon:yes gene_type:complete
MINNKFEAQVTLIVPTQDGQAVEINFTKDDIKEIPASQPLVEEIKSLCTPVATSKDYNLLVLDF